MTAHPSAGTTPAFDPSVAFSRTIGFVTKDELQRLQQARVAIAGMGGVGGIHLQTLARLGIGKFNIADFDHYEMHNFNRQAGAYMSTLDQPKSRVMAAMARDINPTLEINEFAQGVTPENLDAFLDGVDLYIDGLDFFAFDARAMVFAACHARGIPAVTVAPLGMGAGLLTFLPGGMSFEQYFRWQGANEQEKALRMLIGLSPNAVHRRYTMDPSTIDLRGRKGPSTPMACSLCAGVAATEALKILLKRGRVHAAPHSVLFDAYLNRCKRSWYPGGLGHPLLRIKLFVATRMLNRMAANTGKS